MYTQLEQTKLIICKTGNVGRELYIFSKTFAQVKFKIWPFLDGHIVILRNQFSTETQNHEILHSKSLVSSKEKA